MFLLVLVLLIATMVVGVTAIATIMPPTTPGAAQFHPPSFRPSRMLHGKWLRPYPASLYSLRKRISTLTQPMGSVVNAVPVLPD
jgi:hypothetical protein